MGALYIKYTWSIGECATWCNIPAPSSCRSLVAFNLSAPKDICNVTFFLWRIASQDVCEKKKKKKKKKGQNFHFSLDISHNISHLTYLLTYFHAPPPPPKKKWLYNLKSFGDCHEACRFAGSYNNIQLGTERVNNVNDNSKQHCHFEKTTAPHRISRCLCSCRRLRQILWSLQTTRLLRKNNNINNSSLLASVTQRH